MKKNRKKKMYEKSRYMATRILAGGTLLLLVFFVTLIWLAEKKEPMLMRQTYKEDFIEQVAQKAQSVQREFGVLPSISISQAILESNWGTSTLAKENHNYYGIKGSNSSNSTIFQTKEFIEETKEWIQIEAPFRMYTSFEESMDDHAKLLVHGTKWNPELYQKVIDAPTYKEAAHALHQAGYATDPNYPEKLIRLIEQYELFKYDQPIP